MARATGETWEKERKVVRSIQVAFDLEERVQAAIRQEALDSGRNPTDQVRQILGLRVARKPKRPRLSISLTDEDFLVLAERFRVPTDDRLTIRQKAAELLVQHVLGDES